MLLYALKLFVSNAPFTSNKSDLAAQQTRDKGRQTEVAYSGLSAVSWKVFNKAPLLVREATGKLELDGEQTKALDPLAAKFLHLFSTATVFLFPISPGATLFEQHDHVDVGTQGSHDYISHTQPNSGLTTHAPASYRAVIWV